MDYFSESLSLHKQYRGKIEVISKFPSLQNKDDLSLAYTPGVAEPCRAIAKDQSLVNTYTSRGNMVAIVSDGSAVLGLGNIGPKAALPVMEGKAILFKEFADVDAFPICLDTQDTEEIIRMIQLLEPSFGGINLEDISAPRCFEIEQRLKETCSIPIFHDDQHGTAIVVLAGLINALKLTKKNISEIKIVVSGVGAAGVATTKLLLEYGADPKNFLLIDSKGIIFHGRKEGMNPVKEELAVLTNPEKISGTCAEALKNADVFIGVSQPGVLTQQHVRSMAKDSIIFAMANPVPEIMPDEAKAAGAAIIATGRSDFPNQINNVLAFPGIFRGVFDMGAIAITEPMKIAAAQALASHVKDLTPEHIIPNALDKTVSVSVADAVKKVAKRVKKTQ